MIKPRSLKSDKRYKDAPRFPLILEYEKEFKDNYKQLIEKMSVDIGKQMIINIKP